MAGELASADAARAALDLANAGVLVLAAAPGGSAVGALERLLLGFAPDERSWARGALADALVAVVAQRLLHAADGNGRLAAHEILLGSAALAAMIRDDKMGEIPSLMQAGTAVGMQTMDVALERLYQRGLVSSEEALDHATDKDAVQRVLVRRTAPVV
jgi:twitching motility protein PilT